MINGIDYLKKMYPDCNDKDYQPSGLDLRAGNLYSLCYEDDKTYGLIDGKKYIPKHEPVKPTLLQVKKDDYIAGWFLEPNVAYIIQVANPIKIGEANAQLYVPRSTLIRSGVNVYSSLGDLGYFGTLSFMIINHSHVRFFLGANERFAQLIDFEVQGGGDSYNGDYQEDLQKKEWFIDNEVFLGVGENGYPLTIFGQSYYHDGYLCVQNEYLHKLIYEFFFGEIDSDCVVHHINHNKLDDRIGNLIEMTDKQHRSLHNKGISNPSCSNRKYDLPFGFTKYPNGFMFQYHDNKGQRQSKYNKRLDYLLHDAVQILNDLDKNYKKEIDNILKWSNSHDISVLTFSRLERNHLPYRCSLHKKKSRDVYEFQENGKYIGGSVVFSKAVDKAIKNTKDPLYADYLEKRWKKIKDPLINKNYQEEVK